MRERTMQVYVGRDFQAKGAVFAKALTRGYIWKVLTIARR